ncbi:MAG TPA: hypothetical protein VID69_04445 [Actinomycetota bacterium]|jgi:hypothetical protein
MIGRIVRPLAAAGITLAALVAFAPAALAHEGRSQGDLEMVVGFGTEPAYAGQPNSVQIVLVHDGEPVVDLGDTLGVEVAFGDATMELELEPNFSVGEFGEPGDYRAWFIPTRAGEYTFHFTGTVDGEDVDQSFTSGPDTFGDVGDPAELMFPVQDPSTGEIAERLEREVPRMTAAVEEAGAQADLAAEEAAAAADDASSANTMALIGIVVGALGLIVAIVAIVLSRRRTA